jgi:hypothetical protein
MWGLSGLNIELLKQYIILRKQGRPLGVRETQRILGLNSPGKAQRILKRLVRLGLAERLEDGKYVIKPNPPLELIGKAIIRGHIIPRLLFLTIYSTVFTILLIIFLKPDVVITVSYILLVIPLWIESLHEYLQVRKYLRRIEGG